LRDALTGLNNRLGLQRAIESGNASDHGLTGRIMLALDVDAFKEINDTYGHVMGDKVLCKIAEILGKCLGESDHALARISGDEFVVVLSSATVPEAAKLAEGIRATVQKVVIAVDGVQHLGKVSVSIGVAPGRSRDTLEMLRHRADEAMYRAKDLGRNRVYAVPETPADSSRQGG
jgi:diguanylate cyclase (GGDEF)-like protein